MASDLGIALVGCGRIAKKYVEILSGKHVEGAKLIAACDPQENRAADFSKKYNFPCYKDVHQMLEGHLDEIDALAILTESGNHPAHVRELAKYKKHFIVEKPMALTLEDADSMNEVCDRHGVKLFVVKQNRYNKPVQALRNALEDGRFGKLVLGTVRVRWCRTQEYYDQDAWRGTWKLDGGVFANQASHHIDLLMWMLGEPISVYSTTRTALVDIEAEDTGVSVIKFKSGAIGIVEATTASRPKDLEGSLSILGETGTVEIGGFAVNQMKTWQFETEKADDKSMIETCNENPPNVYGFGHVPYLEHVVRSIRKDEASLVDGLEGRRSLELISAMYESAATGKEVQLRFKAKQAKLGYV